MNCYEGKRYVVFCDILGFKSWIQAEGSKEVFNYVKGYLDMMIKASMPGATVNADMTVNYTEEHISYIYFSDSIVFYSKDDSYDSFKSLMIAANAFMNTFITGVSYMVRGGIAYGEFYVDTETNSYIGQALIDAYALEESINWLGLCFEQSVVDTPNFSKFQQEYPGIIHPSLVPTLRTNLRPYALNWADNGRDKNGVATPRFPKPENRLNSGSSFDAYESLRVCLERRKKEIGDNPIELRKVEERINNTIAFIEHCEDSLKSVE